MNIHTRTIATTPLAPGPGLARLWQHTIAGHHVVARELWARVVAVDGSANPMVLRVDGLPDGPRPPVLSRLVVHLRAFSDAVDADGTLALLLHRPGWGPPDHTDLGWAQGLQRRAVRANLDLAPVHLATEDSLGAILAPRAAA